MGPFEQVEILAVEDPARVAGLTMPTLLIPGALIA